MYDERRGLNISREKENAAKDNEIPNIKSVKDVEQKGKQGKINAAEQ